MSEAVYTLTDPDANAWECSNCEEVWILNNDGPAENRMKYCPFCGSRIVSIDDRSDY